MGMGCAPLVRLRDVPVVDAHSPMPGLVEPGEEVVLHHHREHHREQDAGKDAGNQHGGGKHARRHCVLRFDRLRRVHHAERAEVTGREGHHDPDAPVHPVVIDVDGQDARNVERLIVAEEEQRQKGGPQQDGPYQVLGLGPGHPGRQQAAEHGAHVERQEAADTHEQIVADDEVAVRALDVGVNGRKHGQRNEEHEKHVEQLRERLLKDGPVRWAGARVGTLIRFDFLLL